MSNLEASNLFSVKGMMFVITGGGSGIGAMFAKALDINGASKVYILGRRLEKLEEVASAAENSSIIPIQCDITSKTSLSAAVTQIQHQTPFINTLIANSGTTGPTIYGLPTKDRRRPTTSELHQFLWSTPPSEFTQTFEVNTTGPFYTFVAFLPLLAAGNESEVAKGLGVTSQFIVTGSIGAFSRRPGMGFAYAGSKMAMMHVVKQLGTVLADWGVGIRCNVFCPGVYPSEMSEGLMGTEDITKEGSVKPEVIPLTRAGTEEDAGGALLFMVSRAGAYTNGNVLISDGGRMSIVPATY